MHLYSTKNVTEQITTNTHFLRGRLYGSRAGPPTGIARLARSRHAIVFMVKMTVCLYEQTGWPAYRDLA